MQEKFKVKRLNFLIPKKLKKLVNFSKIKMIKIRKDKENKYKMEMIGNKKYKNTKQIEKLYRKRRQYCNTYMHKASKMIVNYAIENECDRIIIGNMKNIKQEMKNNKRFVEMPIQELVQKIKYKADD